MDSDLTEAQSAVVLAALTADGDAVPLQSVSQQLNLSYYRVREVARQQGLLDERQRTVISNERADLVWSHLQEYGGTVFSACIALDIPRHAIRTITQRLEERGLNTNQYRYYKEQHGCLEGQPNPRLKVIGVNPKVSVRCMCCGKVHRIYLSNFKSFTSKRCSKCPAEPRQQRTHWTITGDKFRYQSIAELARAYSDELPKYQTLRQRLLKDNSYTTLTGKVITALPI